MARDLHYFALEFDNDGPVARHHFVCATDAEEGAGIIARLSGGAVAYQQWGDDALDVWDEPDVLFEVGTLPRWWHERWSNAA